MTAMSDLSVVALVPMRHHSTRVEGKNYREIAGRPLYTYILNTLLTCESISKIVVNTDSPVIKEGLQRDYPQIRIVNRPNHLTADDVPMNDILLHDVQQVPEEFYLQTHSTNPLLKPETVESAIERFARAWPEKDSLFSVTPYQTRLWTADGKAVNHNPDELIPTQDLEPLFVENSCLYIFSREGLIERGNRIGNAPILYPISNKEAVDIDTEWEFEFAEILLAKRGQIG
jgi:CMP-N-acetylneuraminic acid synthetase